MSIRSRRHGHGPKRMTAVLAMTAVFLVSAAGCGNQRAEQESAAKPSEGESKATASAPAKPRAKRADTPVARHTTKSSGSTTRIRLVQKGCVQFEPHWTNIRVGQTLAWHSDLKSSATIHVTPGTFDKTDYVVPAGGNASTGPARHPGSYSISTKPLACQGVPRGVKGSAPGVTVEEAIAQR